MQSICISPKNNIMFALEIHHAGPKKNEFTSQNI
jgi:hypothetical protein